MGLKVKETGGNYELPPEETTLAVCVVVADIGLQDTTYMGDTRTTQQVIITWELPRQLMKDGRPFVQSKTYTASLNEKANLRKDLEAWRGKKFTDAELADGFDMSKLLKQWCSIGITHAEKNGKTYANISSISKLLPEILPATKSIKIHNTPVYFDLDNFDEESYNALPEWIRNKIDNRVNEDFDENVEPGNEDLFDGDSEGRKYVGTDPEDVPF